MAPGAILRGAALSVVKTVAATLQITKTVRTKVEKPAAKKKQKKPLANVPQVSFLTTEDETTGDVYHQENTALSKERRKELNNEIPQRLCQTCYPYTVLEDGTFSDEFPLGYRELKEEILHWVETDEGAYPAIMRLGIETVIKLGLLEKMVRKQEIVLTPGFKEKLKSLQKNGGSTFLMGMTSSTGGGDYSVTLGPIARGAAQASTVDALDELVIEYLALTREIANAAIEYAIPEPYRNKVQKHNMIDASMCMGSLESPSFISSDQLNLTDPRDRKLKAINKFGNIHVDASDCPHSWTAMSNFSHLAEDYYPGNFLFTSLRLWCTMNPFEIIVFQGGMPHVSRGIGPSCVPEDSPLRYRAPPGTPRPDHENYMRAVDPTYPTKTMVRPTYLPKAEVLSRRAIKTHWENRETLRDWEMRYYIMRNAQLKVPSEKKSNPNGGKRNPPYFEETNGESVELKLTLPKSYQDLDPEEVVKLFPWTDEETNQTRYPSVERAKLCIQGHQEIDLEWETSRSVTKACCLGVSTTKWQDRRKQERLAHALKVAPYIELNRKMRSDYKERYEATGIVKPVGPSGDSKKNLGDGSVKRGQLTEQYRQSRANVPKHDLDPETWKEANDAVRVGEELNRAEQLERKERYLYPEKDDQYEDKAVYVPEITAALSGLSVSDGTSGK